MNIKKLLQFSFDDGAHSAHVVVNEYERHASSPTFTVSYHSTLLGSVYKVEQYAKATEALDSAAPVLKSIKHSVAAYLLDNA